MPSYVASIWRESPSVLVSRAERVIDAAFSGSAEAECGRVFFRADDVAVPGKRFGRMMELFARYRAPLSLAVVPAWLTRARWQYLKSFEKMTPSLCCWHQHGWRHVNHETEGKKQEFGDTRRVSEIRHDLSRGKDRLEQIMTEDFFPVFTPPWNRCGNDTLQVLKDLGFVAISRSFGSKPQIPKDLSDFFVNVDLHTRKEKDPAAGWNNLLMEFKQAAKSGYCGIMLHHQMMNDAAFEFLAMLLGALTNRKNLQLVNFKDLADQQVFNEPIIASAVMDNSE